MLKAADYLDKAFRAEESAKRAASPQLRESLNDMARAWRSLAASAFSVDSAYSSLRTPFAH